MPALPRKERKGKPRTSEQVVVVDGRKLEVIFVIYDRDNSGILQGKERGTFSCELPAASESKFKS